MCTNHSPFLPKLEEAPIKHGQYRQQLARAICRMPRFHLIIRCKGFHEFIDARVPGDIQIRPRRNPTASTTATRDEGAIAAGFYPNEQITQCSQCSLLF